MCVCVCLAYTSEDFHMKTHRYTEDSTPSEDPKTGPRKTLAKNAKNVMFYHLRGVRAPRTSTDFQPYLIYEDIRVLGSISKASGGVCVYVCPAMRFAMLRGMGLKLGMGIGDGPPRLKSIFSKWPHQRSKVIQRSSCLRNAPWLPNLVGRIPDQRVMHCWGQRSCRGHPGSTRCQIA